MRTACLVAVAGIAAVCYLCSVIATPVAIGSGLYYWSSGVPLPQAAWSAFVTWIIMLAAFFPGICFHALFILRASDAH